MRKGLTVLLVFVMMMLASCSGKTPHSSTAEGVLAGDSSVKEAEASAAGKAESGTELKSNSETDPDADPEAASDAESEAKSESVKESDAEEKAPSYAVKLFCAVIEGGNRLESLTESDDGRV